MRPRSHDIAFFLRLFDEASCGGRLSWIESEAKKKARVLEVTERIIEKRVEESADFRVSLSNKGRLVHVLFFWICRENTGFLLLPAF